MEHTFDHEYWDGIWQGDRAPSMEAGQPNPHLVDEVDRLAPGTALDAGCGAGAEAIWLAGRGWQVTAVDIASAALDRAAERAAASDVASDVGGQVHWVRADLATWEPGVRYDLVTTHYAHPAMPQLDFYDRIADWVATDGTLLIVGHLHSATAGEPHAHSAAHSQAHDHAGDDGPPASASATAAGITARLDPSVWKIATASEAHRSVSGRNGRETTIHDVVVRAVRRC
jgi:SAM-dependent methyltransferase